MVDLYIGPKREHCHVHKELLDDNVPHFNKMFNGEFKEAMSRSAEFPEYHPQSFDLLLSWVYRGRYESLSWTEVEIAEGKPRTVT
jgi:hypothetical protein